MEEIRRIKDVYPEVDYIRINYTYFYALEEKENYEMIIPNDRRYNYYYATIRCCNKDCTSRGFDLSSEVSDAIYRKKKITGEKECTGKLSEKYIRNPNQTCDCSIKFTIEAVFKKE